MSLGGGLANILVDDSLMKVKPSSLSWSLESTFRYLSDETWEKEGLETFFVVDGCFESTAQPR